MKSTTKLLDLLRRKNEAEATSTRLKQEVAAPSLDAAGIPTLLTDAYIPNTPMLEARFNFAGTWVNAAFGHTWLGIHEMESAWTDQAIQKHLGIRKKYYDGHLLQRVEWDRIALFGIDLSQCDETLLFWNGNLEPCVYSYVGYEKFVYDDLDAFLRALL